MYKIIGRNFEYDEALKIIQFEEYTEDIDFDEIKRHDVQKRTVNFENQKSNLRRGRKNDGKNPGSGDNMKNQKKKVKKSEEFLNRPFDSLTFILFMSILMKKFPTLGI